MKRRSILTSTMSLDWRAGPNLTNLTGVAGCNGRGGRRGIGDRGEGAAACRKYIAGVGSVGKRSAIGGEAVVAADDRDGAIIGALRGIGRIDVARRGEPGCHDDAPWLGAGSGFGQRISDSQSAIGCAEPKALPAGRQCRTRPKARIRSTPKLIPQFRSSRI